MRQPAVKKTAETMRQDALAMLRKAKEMEAKEKNEKFNTLGGLVIKFVNTEISSKEFLAEVKNITGKEFILNTKGEEYDTAKV